MGDWTSQNWTKRDGRNNQEQQQQEKKVTYKTAAELAVKKRCQSCCQIDGILRNTQATLVFKRKPHEKCVWKGDAIANFIFGTYSR